MKPLERFIYQAIVCLLAGALGASVYHQRQPLSNASFRHVEIEDGLGHPRMILGTDADGTAELRLISEDGEKVSRLQQFKDGSTSMSFAGSANESSVRIENLQHGFGPIISLTGNDKAERLYLGAANYQDDMPPAEPYAWGLYLPAGGFKSPFAAIGAYRDLKTGQIQGFAYPEK